jgi:hypothetical protein
MKSRLRSHRHPNGHWCHCPFGNQDPYIAPAQREAYGSKLSLWHEASKLDWLRDRPDMQHHEAQRLLDRLELTYPDHDALYPWLVREHKKGRVNDPYGDALSGRFPVGHQYYGDDDVRYFREPFHYTNNNGYKSQLTTDHLDQVNDWMKYMKQAKKGVDIMAHEIGPALHNAEQSDLGGENVHTFDNGYWIAKLRNKRDMVREGDRMHHCIGGGHGYIQKNDAGEGMYYSLRTPDNQPVGTAEIDRDQDDYFKCPHCNKFTFKEFLKRPDGSFGGMGCEHCGGDLAGAQGFENDLRKHKHPDAKYTSISQMFGPHDNKMDEWHNDMFNQYFGQHGHSDYESDGDAEEEEFEPWWDSWYSVPGAETPEQYISHMNGEYHEDAPDEYQRAEQDAYEHDLEPPELTRDDPDFDSVFDNLTENEKPDPHLFNTLWEAARNEGHADIFNDKAKEWLENYRDWLDPYGTNMDNYPAGPNAHEEYVARNLEHQIGRYRDPQTGDTYEDQNQLGSVYPEYHPSWGAPRFTPGKGVPEFPAPPERQQDYQNMMRERQLGNDQPSVLDGSGAGNWRDLEKARGRGEPLAPVTPPFSPSGPVSPETFFGPGQETTTEHQRALPLNWEDSQDYGANPRPNAPYNPASPEMYQRGQQQGNLWPTGWYIDYAQKRAMETKLPEHLFMPEHFGYHAPQNQSTMWSTNWFAPGNPTMINTQHDDVSALGEAFGQDPRPTGQWHAKTAGPWTETEDKGGRKRPTKNQDKGYGIYDIPVHEGVPHLHGRVVVHNHPNPTKMPGHDWRVPVVYDKDEDKLYVGQRGMEHGDMMQSFHKDNPWGVNFDASAGMTPGYIDLDSHIGGGLNFFKEGQVPDEDELHDWVEQEYGVRNSEYGSKPDLDIDWDNEHESSYHPAQEDEWVAEDEPVFSALIPEPRWVA